MLTVEHTIHLAEKYLQDLDLDGRIETRNGRPLGTMIKDNECHCVQFSRIPDVLCGDCNGTGELK